MAKLRFLIVFAMSCLVCSFITQPVLGQKMDDGMKAVNATNRLVPDFVDCFGLPRLLSKLVKNLFKTDESRHVNTRFLLYTRFQRQAREVTIANVSLAKDAVAPGRRTVAVVHGFMSDGTQQWVLDMVKALLDKEDVNVVSVDWSGGGGSWKYWRAVANTRVAGVDITRFFEKMISLGLSKDDMHLIGHSLGAHIVSYVASHLGGVARITGLDPAQPCYRVDDPSMTLDKGDARFVDVIHTNGRQLKKLGLGLPHPIGHVDFFPNGGMKQPGCGPTGIFKFLPIIPIRLQKAICSHGRSYMFFTESIRLDNCSFWGHHWDMKEETIRSAIETPCTEKTCSEMGLEADIFPARGSFYVETADDLPYCISRPGMGLDKSAVETLKVLSDNNLPAK